MVSVLHTSYKELIYLSNLFPCIMEVLQVYVIITESYIPLGDYTSTKNYTSE